MTPALCAVVAWLAAAPAPKVAADVESWLALDTNAKRLPDGPLGGAPAHLEPGAPPEEPVADGLQQTDAALDVEIDRPGLVLTSESLFGLKLFFTQASERMLVGQSRATLTSTRMPLGTALTVSLLGKARGQLSGARTYALLDATALVDKPVLSWLTLRGGVHGQGFHSFDIPLFSSASAGVLLGARAAAGPESLELLFDLGGSGYPFSSKTFVSPGEPGFDPALRADGVTVASLTATSARRLYLSVGYTLTRDASNARGVSFTRHRLSAAAGVRLPGDVDCVARAAVQLTRYDDGVAIGQLYFVGDADQENSNVLQVTLSRALFGGLSAVFDVAFLANELAVEGARFSRETAAVGIRADL